MENKIHGPNGEGAVFIDGVQPSSLCFSSPHYSQNCNLIQRWHRTQEAWYIESKQGVTGLGKLLKGMKFSRTTNKGYLGNEI